MGRFACTDPPLLCRIFPRRGKPSPASSTENRSMPDKKQHSFSNFRPIIPRSLSGNFNACIDSTLLGYDSHDYHCGKRPSLQSYLSVPYDPTTYFFSRYGSSFNQFPQMRCNESPERRAGMQFTVVHLQSVLALAKKLLTKEILTFLDEEAQQVSTFKLYVARSDCVVLNSNCNSLYRSTVPAKCISSHIVHLARR